MIPATADVCPNCTRRINIHPAFMACAVIVVCFVAMVVLGFVLLSR